MLVGAVGCVGRRCRRSGRERSGPRDAPVEGADGALGEGAVGGGARMRLEGRPLPPGAAEAWRSRGPPAATGGRHGLEE
uniref:Uncharacterized protein n=1 Tax=Setaria italica TaxID=4555 RepID=K3YXB3_SETIT